MQRQRVVLIGAGRRILTHVLPVFEALEDTYELSATYTRSPESVATRHELRPLSELRSLEGIDLVHVAVDKDAIPEVLKTLAELGPAHTDLMIDTPVLRFRHFLHLQWLDHFRSTWVPEDCATLPWIPAVQRAIAAGDIGDLHTLHFDRTAYAYHGLALAKTLAAGASSTSGRITSGRVRRVSAGLQERRLRLSNGLRLVIVEPRNYLRGHLRLIGSRGVITERREGAPNDLWIQMTLEGERIRSFRVGDHEEHLSEVESDLTIPASPEEVALASVLRPDASVFARQGLLKRVGLYRLLRNLHAGRGAYPLLDGVDDMVCDYFLEKIGCWWDTPFTNPSSAPARLLYRSLSFLGG
jgi:hypothetical protein